LIIKMKHTYTFVFAPEPEGGFAVTCPALSGLVTYGETLAEAKVMGQDAMDGLATIQTQISPLYTRCVGLPDAWPWVPPRQRSRSFLGESIHG
jgi:predicted RNase H-like HicB family nuclease